MALKRFLGGFLALNIFKVDFPQKIQVVVNQELRNPSEISYSGKPELGTEELQSLHFS